MRKRKTWAAVAALIIVTMLISTGCTFTGRTKEDNPYTAWLLNEDLCEALDSITRIDDTGYLYTMEFDGGYENSAYVESVVKLVVQMSGCSAFNTYNESGEYISCRNYDWSHTDESGNPTGCNVIVRCKPAGKLESIAIADAAMMNYSGADFVADSLVDGDTDVTMLAAMPYFCQDGMNEAGFSVSLLALDTKEGEHPTKQNEEDNDKIIISVLLREILDNCVTIDDAIELAKSYNVVNVLGYDYHLLVTEGSGKQSVLEWRNNELTATDTNVVTNFYVNSDDADDTFEPVVTAENTAYDYHYGYGHGYKNFKSMAETLQSNLRHYDNGDFYVMNIDKCKELLQSVADSATQYSVIFNHKNLITTIYVGGDFDKPYQIKFTS